MKIKKSHLLKGKRYIVIIDADKEIVEDKIYPAIFKEVHVADKIPKWFADWEKANSSKPPQWFTSWTTSFEKKNDERWDQQEKFNKNQEAFNKKNDEHWDQQEKFNKNQEAFNKKNDERWERQEKFNKNQEAFNKKNDERWERQEKFNQNISQDIKDIKKDIQLMKNTPTMHKELLHIKT